MLNNAHWNPDVPDFKQRMTRAEWKKILLKGREKIIYRGKVIALVAKDIGYGVVEVSKPQQDEKGVADA